MRLAHLLFAVLALALAGAMSAQAQEGGQGLSALAQLDPARSALTAEAGGTRLTLGLSQPVPYRVYLLDSPPRMVIDFREVNFAGASPKALLGAPGVTNLRWGAFRPGWSRLVAELDGPQQILAAEERTGAATTIEIHFAPVPAADFATRTGAPQSALWDLPQPAVVDPPHRRQSGETPLRVVLDPGHGGIDPGAEIDALSEAVLALTFARDLKDHLTRAGVQVVMTRDENIFVPLETRVTVARAAGADIFISLHADALAEGQATGATIYLLADTASDAASAKLAERHDRADLLAGVDLDGHDDAIAGVLMDLARAETQPRAVRLSQVLAATIKAEGLKMHKHPVQSADFSVLKAPDIPSILLELGFMSSSPDRARLNDPDWRARMAGAITTAILTWAQSDAAEARLLRQ
ncbi:N-acetylmuramoyl-L-alanine amidase [Phaeovulum sp.]|uniref:N-acetylmuramoyl-L-alanine amidase n=1 Tax=Phaeovulum sp. TaxID=2934796 RepID=UPI0039E6C168